MIEIPNYTIESELGRGGMATVYLAVQDMLSRHVALKVMLPDMARDQNFRNSFLSEGKIIANLEHTNIVRVYDVGVIDDAILYMAMENLVGGTLKDKLIDRSLSYAESLRVLEQVAAGLSYAHGNGYIHRDVKPGNILFRENGTAVLTDFGIAKLQDTTGELTRMGYTMGTVQYMSPEQAITTDLDSRSDIYSLGLVFYEMLTGQKAFKAESTIQAIHQHTTVAPPELPEKYGFLQIAIDKVLAKDPSDRYQTVDEFINAVKDAADVDKTIIRKIPDQSDFENTRILEPSTPKKKKRGGIIIALIGGISLLGLLVFGVIKKPQLLPWVESSNKQKAVIQKEDEGKKVVKEEHLISTLTNTNDETNKQDSSLIKQSIGEKNSLKEEKQIAEAKKLEEEKRIAEAKKLEEEKRISEAKKLVEEKRIAEAKKLEEEKRIAEAKNLEEEKRIAEAKKLEEEKRIAEAKKLEAEKRIAEAKKREEEQLARQARKDKQIEEERLAKKQRIKNAKAKKEKERKRLAKKKAEKKRKKLALQKANQTKIAALKAKKLAEAKRKKQNLARSKAHIKVSATLNGRPLKTSFVLIKNGKRVQTISGRYNANFTVPAGRYTLKVQYAGQVGNAAINVGASETAIQRFAFKSVALARRPAPQTRDTLDPKWEYEHILAPAYQ